MKISNWLVVASVIMATITGCSGDEEVITARPVHEAAGESEDIGESDGDVIYASRVYVLDVRFSRQTCATGPGVCFKDGFGNIWDYNYFDRWADDGDVGPIGVELDGDQLRLVFYRSLEEDLFIIHEDVKVNESLCRALGRSFTIKAGEYPVSFEGNEFGAALVSIIPER